MAKIRKSTLIPIALLVYLAVMATIGWRNWQAGQLTTRYYFGMVAITLLCIILLHFSLRRRERLRDLRDREDDTRNANQSKTTNQ